MNILLIFHILIALSSVFYTAYALFSPSRPKLHTTYILTTLTIATGTVLVATKPTHLTQTCETGLVYLAVMVAGIFALRYKLAKQI